MSWVGKCFTSLFFLFFLGMGSVFVWFIARDAFATIRTWSWTKTDCEIISSDVSDKNPKGVHTGDFYVDIKYHYHFGGQEITSSR